MAIRAPDGANKSQVDKIRSPVLVSAEGKQLRHCRFKSRRCRHDRHQLHDVQASTRIWPIIIAALLVLVAAAVVFLLVRYFVSLPMYL